jgi:hypothetical protein
VTITDADFQNIFDVQTLQILTSGGSTVTLGSNASADVGGAGHTFTIDVSGAAGSLTLDGSGMTGNLKVLLGTDGHDILSGGAGDDIFQFGAPPTAGNDLVTNFNNTTQHDAFAVSAAGFGGGLTAGHDATTAGAGGTNVFESSGDNQFTSSADRFHFDTTAHALYYSADGTTAHEVLLATVTNGASVHGNDIHVV